MKKSLQVQAGRLFKRVGFKINEDNVF